MNSDDILILLIILLPLLGALLSWIVDTINSGGSRFLGVLTIGTSGISALIVFIKSISENFNPEGIELNLLLAADDTLRLVINPDVLSVFMALVAAFLGFLIAVFSIQYMAGDEALTRYWFYLQMFIFGMVLLVLAGDLILMYAGWETVGLCSFGLISHWHHKSGEQGEKCAKAGVKAFVYTRIGDIGFLLAIVWIYMETKVVDFEGIALAGMDMEVELLRNLGILFLLSAFGKSAQFPFIPWLSSPEKVDIDAMQGPTTVSALIHAATMVKAGVYMVSRLFLTLPLWKSEIYLDILVIVAGGTALIAALSALVSFDLKRVLAYSTVSQLAYMFLGLGIANVFEAEEHMHEAGAAFLASQFHLISHAIFKSLLFLTAGYIIHEVGSRDMRELKGAANWNTDKVAFIGLLFGGAALSGVIGFNGWWSKEAIIGVAYAGMAEGIPLLTISYILAVLTALVTALYVARMFYYMFAAGKSHESHGNTQLMHGVIIILSVLTLVGGALYFMLGDYFSPVLADHEFHAIDLFGWILTAIILITLILAYRFADINLESFFLFKWIAVASRNGFWLEATWNGLWIALRNGSYQFRRTHTGNLNNIMLGSFVLTILILAFAVGM